jgi:hypothetical protein
MLGRDLPFSHDIGGTKIEPRLHATGRSSGACARHGRRPPEADIRRIAEAAGGAAGGARPRGSRRGGVLSRPSIRRGLR